MSVYCIVLQLLSVSTSFLHCRVFLNSVISALLGIFLVVIIATYVFIEFFLDPSKLRSDKHFQQGSVLWSDNTTKKQLWCWFSQCFYMHLNNMIIAYIYYLTSVATTNFTTSLINMYIFIIIYLFIAHNAILVAVSGLIEGWRQFSPSFRLYLCTCADVGGKKGIRLTIYAE